MASRIKIKRKHGTFTGETLSPVLTEFHSRFNGACTVWRPPTDLIETDDRYLVSVEVAGLHQEELSITYHREYLVISGTREGILAKNGAFHQMEINRGDFATEIRLHAPVDLDATKAVYARGLLTVTLPKIKKTPIPVRQT